MAKARSKEKKLQSIIDSERVLNEIQDVDVLLDRLLTEARSIVHADAGSIYILDSEEKNLCIRHAQNDTQQDKLLPGEELPFTIFSFPVSKSSISGYSVLTGEIVNVPDAYAIPSDRTYKFDKRSDILNGYKTKSMLTIPLKASRGRPLGVLQILNPKDSSGNITDFDEDSVLYVQQFADSAARALERDKHITKEQKLQRIIESERILSEIKDIDVLLERILTEARSIVHADAGSIYVLEGESTLKIKYAQNDAQQSKMAPGQKMPFSFFSFPISETSISGYSVLSGHILNIPDAYSIPADKPYKFNKQSDMLTGYKTTSMLTIPLMTSNGKVLGVLQIINAQDSKGNIIAFDEDAELYIKHFADSASQAMERTYLTRAMVMRMITMAGYRDPKETGAHVNRVSSYAVEIYDRWAFNHNVPEEEKHKYRDTLKIAAMLHDVGKVAVSDTILKAPRRFTPEEYEVIKAHTYIGADLFSSIESSLDEMSRDVALRHHERWDGKGYPGYIEMNDVMGADTILKLDGIKGLKGEEIPLSARIVGLADVFDALSSKRVYKQAWDDEEVLEEIRRCSGTQFDPEVVNSFFEVLPRIREIQAANPEK